VTLLIRQDIAVSFNERPLLLLFLFPIVLSAVLVGFGPGLLATALSVAGLSYFAIPPIGSFAIEKSYDVFQMGFLASGGLLVSYLSMMLHDARHRADSERRIAESHLAEKVRAMNLLDSIAEGSSDAPRDLWANPSSKCWAMTMPLFSRRRRQLSSRATTAK